jgi:hypothetical protein
VFKSNLAMLPSKQLKQRPELCPCISTAGVDNLSAKLESFENAEGSDGGINRVIFGPYVLQKALDISVGPQLRSKMIAEAC